jgi:hypothetical protein
MSKDETNIFIIQTQDKKKIDELVNLTHSAIVTKNHHFYTAVINNEQLPMFHEFRAYELGYELSNVHHSSLKTTHLNSYFDISNDVLKKYNYQSMNVKDAINVYFKNRYNEQFGENLPSDFEVSRLYQTTMNQLLKEYYQQHFRDENSFLKDSSFKKMIHLFYDIIKMKKIDKLRNLSYQIVYLLYD